MVDQLFIGRLPRTCKTRELEDIFYRYGRMTRCDVKQGLKMSYGFIEYEDIRDAEDAIRNEHGRDMGGSRIVVEWARGPKYDYRRDYSRHDRDKEFRRDGSREKERPRRRSRSRDRGFKRRSRSASFERDRGFKRRSRSGSFERRRSRSRSPCQFKNNSRRVTREARSHSRDKRRSGSRSADNHGYRSRSGEKHRSRSRSVDRYRNQSKSSDQIGSRSNSVEGHHRSRSKSVERRGSCSRSDERPRSRLRSDEHDEVRRSRSYEEARSPSTKSADRDSKYSRSPDRGYIQDEMGNDFSDKEKYVQEIDSPLRSCNEDED